MATNARPSERPGVEDAEEAERVEGVEGALYFEGLEVERVEEEREGVERGEKGAGEGVDGVEAEAALRKASRVYLSVSARLLSSPNRSMISKAPPIYFSNTTKLTEPEPRR